MPHPIRSRPRYRTGLRHGNVVPLAIIIALVGSVGAVTSPTTGTAGAQPPPPASTISLAVYFLRGEWLGTAHRTVPMPPGKAVGAAAMRELLAGPNEAEAAAGLTTSIPAGTALRGLAIDAAGVATVDLTRPFVSGGGSLSMAARLAQVVYTLTQFPSVANVRFRLEGEPITVFGGEGLVLDHPVDRGDYEALTPFIFVESPAVGDAVSSPLRVRGTANTFEATFALELRDGAGRVLAERVVTATSGTGTRGTFDVTVPFAMDLPSALTLIVFERSAKDGRPIHLVPIPLHLAP